MSLIDVGIWIASDRVDQVQHATFVLRCSSCIPLAMPAVLAVSTQPVPVVSKPPEGALEGLPTSRKR